MTWTGIIIFTIVICLVAGVVEYRAQRKANQLPFTDPSQPTEADDRARLAGYQEGTGI